MCDGRTPPSCRRYAAWLLALAAVSLSASDSPAQQPSPAQKAERLRQRAGEYRRKAEEQRQQAQEEKDDAEASAALEREAEQLEKSAERCKRSADQLQTRPRPGGPPLQKFPGPPPPQGPVPPRGHFPQPVHDPSQGQQPAAPAEPEPALWGDSLSSRVKCVVGILAWVAVFLVVMGRRRPGDDLEPTGD